MKLNKSIKKKENEIIHRINVASCACFLQDIEGVSKTSVKYSQAI